MNATGNTSKNGGRRLNRIKIFSKVCRFLIGVYAGLSCLLILACWFGWVAILPGSTKITFSEHQTYTAPFIIPAPVLALATVKYGLVMFCALVLYRLLGLYGQGKYFTAKNITYIRFLGYYVVVDWIVNFLLESEAHYRTIIFTQAVTGLVIIFIAWIMDEGRKIKEEQELTV
ncbi:MAG: DUF2975 domain-containing protein [Verrucomicrobiae bacterium]|nr:DUF2975 domain-containing protein [Verrucomicrobiae bacterium]